MAGLISRLFGGRARGPAWVEVTELRRRLEAGGILLVDVRQPEEYASPPGHLPGAINVPLGDLPAHTTDLAACGQPVVVVCRTDRRSARAANELLAAGLRDVAVLRGGTDAWHSQSLPLE